MVSGTPRTGVCIIRVRRSDDHPRFTVVTTEDVERRPERTAHPPGIDDLLEAVREFLVEFDEHNPPGSAPV